MNKKKNLLMCLSFLIGMYAAQCQVVPDQNKYYKIVNKGTGRVLFIEQPELSFLYPTLIAEVRLDAVGKDDNKPGWKFNKLSTSAPVFNIQFKNSSKNIDLPHGNKDIGIEFIIHDETAGDNQKFILISTCEPNTFYISSKESGLLMEVNEKNTSFRVTQEGFTGADTQKWILVELK